MAKDLKAMKFFDKVITRKIYLIFEREKIRQNINLSSESTTNL